MNNKKTPKIQSAPPAILVENVSKTFIVPHEKISTLRGAFTNLFKKKGHDVLDALKDVSFEVKQGEFFGIVGKNGSGKSTLLKILAGVYTADKGSIQINGGVSPFLELGIGFNPELSGRDNIYLNATVLGMTEKEIDEKFDEIVAFSELERFIDQKLKNYSSGMQMRLAFSVSIHVNRDILLMDEVLAVGDVNFQSKCLTEFNRYKKMGKTVVLVTHDISTIRAYCDRAMLLCDGKIEMIGNPEEVGGEYLFQNLSPEERKKITDQKEAVGKSTKEKVIMKNIPHQGKEISLVLDHDLVVADIGCRWGFPEKFKKTTDQIYFYGFDPDREECERLNKMYMGQKVTLVPLGLAESPGKKSLYITREPACSSIYKPDESLIKKYPCLDCITEVSKIEIETTTLDIWAGKSNVQSIDYIKIDTQGSELDILKGARSMLRTVRAIEVEVEFNPIYLGQPLFSDVDTFLRNEGFVLFKFTHIQHYSDKNKNHEAMDLNTMHYDETAVPYEAYGGQIYWADAHYVRKEIMDMEYDDYNQIIRDVVLMKAVGFMDIAHRLFGLAKTFTLK